MVSTGIVQMLNIEEEATFMKGLGYPDYLLTLLGACKVAGVVALLIPRTPLLKEWAYAGFFFMMTGAAFSHLAAGTVNEILPSLLLLTLTVMSWYFRPADRKVILAGQYREA
jgi:hypothetical protein